MKLGGQYVRNLHSKAEIKNILEHGNNDFLTIKKKLGRVISIGQRKHTNDEISRMVGEAIENTFNSKYKGQEIVSEEMIADLSEQVALAYVKFAFRAQK